MRKYSLLHLSDATLALALLAVVRDESAATAVVLAHIAEFDRRRLYREAGYSSMYRYCLGVLHLSEQAAYKRILAARAARQHPWIFDVVADGRLHLSAVVLLGPHLTRENARELLTAAIHKTKTEIERLLAERFPKPDVPTLIEALAVPRQLSPGIVEGLNSLPLNGLIKSACAAELADVLAPVAVHPSVPPARVEPLAPGRFGFQTTIDQETRDLLCRAQELLGHQIPSGDVAAVLKRALSLLVSRLEKQKFAVTDKPQPQKSRCGRNPRYIPNAVKREVWKRDGGRCTFVSESGHRCESRDRIEYDHVDPVARGGYATVERIRLRCRAHNQFEAERVFGAAFMERKREASGSLP